MKEWYRRMCLVPLLIIAAGLFLLPYPGHLSAQSASRAPVDEPIGAPFVIQGDFAAALAYTLALTDGQDQAQAEEALASLGIAPRSGWISDDPVTPDIIGDLQAATGYAADANLLALPRDEALRRFVLMVEESGLAASPDNWAYSATGPLVYPDEPYVADYYVSEGPPVITYYTPPPAYYYLYSWVPCSFWYGGRAFGGYYILRDYHGHHGRHSGKQGSNRWRNATGHRHSADQGYRFGRSAQSHDDHTVSPNRWRPEGQRRDSSISANRARGRMPASRPVVTSPAFPRPSARPEHAIRDAHHIPPTPRTSVGMEPRFSSYHASRPSSSIRSTGGNHQAGAFRGSTARSAAGSWPRGGRVR
jgi:hypothetical protein